MGAAVFAQKPAKAADLGGDCCADLEERVAELEATTVRKGNKKVSVTLYGKANQAVLFWDDGQEKNTYVVDNSYESSRFGFKGSAKIAGNWYGWLQDGGRGIIAQPPTRKPDRRRQRNLTAVRPGDSSSVGIPTCT